MEVQGKLPEKSLWSHSRLISIFPDIALSGTGLKWFGLLVLSSWNASAWEQVSVELPDRCSVPTTVSRLAHGCYHIKCICSSNAVKIHGCSFNTQEWHGSSSSGNNGGKIIQHVTLPFFIYKLHLCWTAVVCPFCNIDIALKLLQQQMERQRMLFPSVLDLKATTQLILQQGVRHRRTTSTPQPLLKY